MCVMCSWLVQSGLFSVARMRDISNDKPDIPIPADKPNVPVPADIMVAGPSLVSGVSYVTYMLRY